MKKDSGSNSISHTLCECLYALCMPSFVIWIMNTHYLAVVRENHKYRPMRKAQVPCGLVGTQLWYTVSEDTLPSCGLGPSWGTRTSRGSNSGLALNYVHIPIYSVIIMLHYMVLGIFIYRILYDWLYVTTEIHLNLTLFQYFKIFSRRKML